MTVGSTGLGQPARLVIVGDVLLDVDLTGSADRLSPEAPVPVVSDPERRARPGGAGLAAMIAARRHSCETVLIGALGRDEAGDEVRALLADAGVEFVDLGAGGETPTKTRVRARDTTLLRVDSSGKPVLVRDLPSRAGTALARADGILVCDYGRGQANHEAVRDRLTRRATHVPLVWDPHPQGGPPPPETTLAVPSSNETRILGADRSPTHQLDADVRLARELREKWSIHALVVTRGAAGAVLVSGSDHNPVVVPSHRTTGDTCGAGDGFAVAAAAALARGASVLEAVSGAVESATRFVALGGVRGLLGPVTPSMAADDALAYAVEVRSRGGRVVGTCGCFDLLHPGHLALLEQARQLGDCLIVCLNSDRSVRLVKGPDRPIVGERHRAAMLRALSCVDGVLVFDETTPAQIIEKLRPDIWVKGGDYAGQRILETDLVERQGGNVVLVDYLDGTSTTSLIDRVRVRGRDASESGIGPKDR